MDKMTLYKAFGFVLVAAMAVTASSCAKAEEQEAAQTVPETAVVMPATEETMTAEPSESIVPETAEIVISGLPEEETQSAEVIEEFHTDAALMGCWNLTEDGYGYTYNFNEDNTGSLLFTYAGETTEVGFVYSAEDGTLKVAVDGETGIETMTYTVDDTGLTFNPGTADPISFTKQESL